jgi:ketosteroid isomerase-like protein
MTEPMPSETSDAIIWDAPNDDHPARRASQNSYAAVARGVFEDWIVHYAPDAVIEDPVGPSMFDAEGLGHHGHEGIRKFWDAAISPISAFSFHITDSHANGNHCANIGTITTTFEDGGQVDTDLVMVYTVDDAGLVKTMKAYWEPERAMATYRKASA